MILIQEQQQHLFKVVIKGDKLEELDVLSTNLMNIKRNSGIVDVDRDFENGKPEIKIGILRENAQRVGVSVEQILLQIFRFSIFKRDSAVSYFEDNGRQFDITVRLKDDFRSSLDDLKNYKFVIQMVNLLPLRWINKNQRETLEMLQ